MDDNRKHQIDDFIIFFEVNNFDSENVNSFIRRYRLMLIFKKILGILLIIFALVLIVIPLPNSLEVGTLFYFNPNDGITVSDIFALIILLLGIVLIIKDNIYYGSIID